ncbi:MAG: CPBP family intramembrane metalloprotease [Verrucomicrobia bacterium]|nr:CPBP family intramembrane metalloprotease [Verrucomicrobiota bacterium]
MSVAPSESDRVPPKMSEVRAECERVNRWRWWIHWAVIGAYPLLIGLIGWGRGGARGPALSGTAHNLLIVCAVELLVFGLVLGLAWIASRASSDDLLLRWRGGFLPVALGFGYSIALRIALGAIMVVIAVALVATRVMTPQSFQEFVMANRPDVEAVVDVTAMRRDPLYFWLTLTLVSFVVAGLREELWRSAFLAGLRTLWSRRFGTRGGQLAAAGVAAVIFGLGHLMQGPLAVGLTTLLGFGLGVIMVFHRSIWPAVMAHGMFDATSLGLLPWVMEKLQQMR